MRNVLFLLLVIISAQGFAQEPTGQTVEVEITHADNDEGQMLVAIYDAESKWLKTIYKGTYGTIEKGVSKVSFNDIPDGIYAISCFHDEDNDGKLDTFLGIPTEDTGASNNAPARMGPPEWEEAKFEIKGKPIKQTIKL